MLVQADLAETFRRLAGEGGDGVYRGRPAELVEKQTTTVVIPLPEVIDPPKLSSPPEVKLTVGGSAGYLTEASAAVSMRWGRIRTPWWSFNPELGDYGAAPVALCAPDVPCGAAARQVPARHVSVADQEDRSMLTIVDQRPHAQGHRPAQQE